MVLEYVDDFRELGDFDGRGFATTQPMEIRFGLPDFLKPFTEQLVVAYGNLVGFTPIWIGGILIEGFATEG